MPKKVHIFAAWNKVGREISGRSLYLLLDYDGTLSPIAKTPEEAIIRKETKELLKRLSGIPGCKIAVISGRSLKDVKRRVGIRKIAYVGNHGFEIEGPRIKFFYPLSSKYKKILKDSGIRLKQKLRDFKGVLIEDKGASLSIHYRLANKKEVPRIKTVFYKDVISDEARGRLRTGEGKRVLEIRPPGDWNKGKVVSWLLARQKKALPIYIGDDITDEDAFKALRNRGLTIFVGSPKKTGARYYMKDTGEVAQFLKRVLKELRRW